VPALDTRADSRTGTTISRSLGVWRSWLKQRKWDSWRTAHGAPTCWWCGSPRYPKPLAAHTATLNGGFRVCPQPALRQPLIRS
jgi:hypothetical protein